MAMSEEMIREFLLDEARRPLLTIKGIETIAKIPQGNLNKFLRGKRSLPVSQINSLSTVLNCIGYNYPANQTAKESDELASIEGISKAFKTQSYSE